ncbi:hypothetical protein [Timonella sp. A28]|uniref:hypothetical protein n=1 Tax=Timonella sp. A28 TaxID=3442640 RepID=UPI003EBC765E
MAKYYFDTKTGKVAQGGIFSWWHKMGPYDTEEEARRALDIARARTEEWDEETRDYTGDDS